MSWTIFLGESLLLFVTIGFLLYKFFTRNFDYWEKRNVPHIKPIPFFGNCYDVATFHVTVAHYFANLYNKFDAPYFGVYLLNKPVIVLKCPELIKAILVKDFDNFCDRTILADEKCDSLFSKVIFVIKNPEWKIIRRKMTPVFTSGKIKGMLYLINEVSVEMVDYIKNNTNKDSIEAKELCSKYATDVIASCAFGINSGSFKNENAEFRAIGRQMFEFTTGTAFSQISYYFLPKLAKLLNLRFYPYGVNEFHRDVFWKAIKQREETNTKRNDLIDAIIQMRRETDHDIDFTGDRVVAQGSMFFAAGFETTSTTMAFALNELALSPTIQNKARSEIKRVFKNHGSFTYEALMDLQYLEMIIFETLRKYPALPFLDRLCVKDYKVPNSDLVIEKDISVFIPMFGIHYDANIYPEPEKFDPERFSGEKKMNSPNFSFLPFGGGPRSCIGERFAILSTKSGLAHIILEYELEKLANDNEPIVLETKSLLIAARGGVPVKFKKIIS